MDIQINSAGMDLTDAIEQHVHDRVHHALGRFESRLTRIEVHLRDENGHKSGPDDQRCMIEARPAGKHPVAVEQHASDMYGAISEAADKLKRVLDTSFAKDAAN
ncbi:MAG: ribosome-associated translation inhibitor RaiA [Planctomycetota bacterium]